MFEDHVNKPDSNEGAEDAKTGDAGPPANSLAQRAKAIDVHIGKRIREHRIGRGLSQQQLAAALGISYQQVHKYETGVNRVSVGRLSTIAEALKIPVSWLLEGLTELPAGEMTRRERMSLELGRNFAMIEDVKHQEALSQLARALAQTGSSECPKPSASEPDEQSPDVPDQE
jgi:transcriptional regulator with XRE-family HTH domain